MLLLCGRGRGGRWGLFRWALIQEVRLGAEEEVDTVGPLVTSGEVIEDGEIDALALAFDARSGNSEVGVYL